MNHSAAIKSIAYYLPEKKVTNQDLQAEFGNRISHKIFEKVGVTERYVIDSETPASYLAIQAAEKLFAENGIRRDSIDALIYCSVHQEFVTPSNSCVLQYKLSLRNDIATYDLSFGCSGYTYGLSLAKSIIVTMGFKSVLLLTSSALSKFIHPQDRASRILFGDAGSATLVSSEVDVGVGEFVFGTDGSGYDKIIIRDGADFRKVTEDSFLEKTDDYGNVYTDAHYFMDAHDVLLFTLKKVPSLIDNTLHKNNLAKEEIDLFVFHQANQFMNEQVRKMAGIDKEKFYLHMQNTGNTVQSTIPIALDAALKEGRIKKGSKVLIAAFGVGYSMCATILKF
ncbi:MAG: ketoacyl-ACP synthase III [Chitinophagales bacterium]